MDLLKGRFDNMLIKDEPVYEDLPPFLGENFNLLSAGIWGR